MPNFDLSWFAAYTRPQHEKVVATSLSHRGYDILFPSYRRASRWKDRVKQLELPLFPGYVFVRCAAARRLPVLQTPGLLHLVGDRSGPISVPDLEIENLQRALASRARLEPLPFVKTGGRVRVCHGPLAGLEGVLLARKDGLRVVISVELLARSVAVEIDGSYLAQN